MNRYEGKDVYCYENSNVLINNFDIRDAKLLEGKERKITLLNTILLYRDVKINDLEFNISFYKHIHSVLFKDIYKFAGKFRSIVLIKGNTRFCEPQFIEKSLNNIFKKLKKENYLSDLKIEEFVNRIAFYYAELNAIHAFREGNGRTNRIFVDLLAKKNNFDIVVEKWNSEKQLEAVIEAMVGENDKLIKLIKKNIKMIK